MLADYPDIEKGDKSYPSCFQKSVTKYTSELSLEKREKMEKIQMEWQSSGPPLEVWLKYFHFKIKHPFFDTGLPESTDWKAIIDAHQMLHQEMFVSCITYSFYPDPDDGVYGIVCWANLLAQGDSFTDQFQKQWLH